MRNVFPAMAVLILAGCGGGTQGLRASDNGIPVADSCDARSHARLVGQSADDRAALSALAPKVRFIGLGDAVTQDVQPDRLNLELNENGVITEVRCG